ncbi:hypothetical protein CWE13_08825 [Aliidiomarina shirensis]|uniref:TIR domain-containing protein n=1 Tax=Aliidiomarina shirensis TaxID=1048642 RepID=A0A432WT70_9GAMM|nr:toll/interleukin-1 receptor domain-containing protein [Aliidiomarina shirensis]RUO36938.1 hypothetical protein CWE13_08825 [Aliidiomarina shirensis]
MINKYVIPSKVIIYLKRIATEYQSSGHDLQARVISSSRIYVHEETSYDNWNGGMNGHDVILFLPPEVFGEVTLARKRDFEVDLLAKLELCCRSIGNEYIHAVRFEDEDQNDPYFQNAALINSRAQIDPSTLSIWKQDHVRLFISHRDKHKAEAKVLAFSLEEYGVSSFVAHDTIEPMTTWQSEIVKGLETMEVMLVYLTDDFHDSVWTNQEVGFALGRDIPVISLKLGAIDPRGFIGERQALKKHSNSMAGIANDIYELIVKRLGNNARFQSALISAFCDSPDFTEAKNRFIRMKRVVKALTDDEVDRIIKAFHENSQLYNAAYLVNHYNRLIDFLSRVSGKTYERSGRDINLKQS